MASKNSVCDVPASMLELEEAERADPPAVGWTAGAVDRMLWKGDPSWLSTDSPEAESAAAEGPVLDCSSAWLDETLALPLVIGER